MRVSLTDRLHQVVRCKFIVALAFAVLIVLPHSGVRAQQVTVLQGGTLIDGTGAAAKADTNVVIRGNRIESIGSRNIPSDATVIDVSGKYIVPGLWDKHLHYKDWFRTCLPHRTS